MMINTKYFDIFFILFVLKFTVVGCFLSALGFHIYSTINHVVLFDILESEKDPIDLKCY